MQLSNVINYWMTKLLGHKIVKANRSYYLQDVMDQKYGHNLTVASGKAIDAQEKPIPWYTYPAIEYLTQFSLKDKSVFEWGSGNSSLFFSERAKKVTSVEAHKEWYDFVSSKKSANHVLKNIPESEFSEAISLFGEKFDIIVIDDLRRYDCCAIASDFLKENGIIILDNSDWFPNACSILREKGLIQVDMHGFGPIAKFTWTTSFFLTKNFNFPLLTDRQPVYSIGALKQTSQDDHLRQSSLLNLQNN